jgi:hypothetical protein
MKLGRKTHILPGFGHCFILAISTIFEQVYLKQIHTTANSHATSPGRMSSHGKEEARVTEVQRQAGTNTGAISKGHQPNATAESVSQGETVMVIQVPESIHPKTG